jgi:hypothetical protein
MRKVALLNTRRPDRDAVVIYVAGLVRSATVSLVGVTVAIYLAEVGLRDPNRPADRRRVGRFFARNGCSQSVG